MYPECSYREVKDLVEAIRADKYWFVHTGKRDAFYVIALTRAQIPTAEGYRARATFVGSVGVTEEAAPYCRRGRVIGMARHGANFVGRVIIPWPEFMKLIKLDSASVYDALLQNQLPPFVTRGVIQELRKSISDASTPLQ